MTHRLFGWLLALVLSEGVWGGPTQLPSGSRITIGYRRVHPDQASKYKEAGTLTDDRITGYTQIGDGVYLTAGYGEWEGKPGDVDCVVTADEEEFRKVAKVILPDESLSDMSYEDIDEYIKSQDSSWDTLKTIRISHIPKYGDGQVSQMLIPQALLNSRGGSLQIQVDCEDAQGPTVEYGQWENTKGDTSIMPARGDAEKFLDLSRQLDASRDLVEQVSDPKHIAQLEQIVTNAMYTAREGARHYIKTAEECKDLKDICRQQIKYYLQDRQAYARFLIRTAERSFEMLTTPLNAVDDAGRQRGVQALQEWAARLQRQVDARAKTLEALKKGEAVKGLDDPKERDLEKTALKRELKAIKKKFSKLVDKAATFGAKEEQGSVPPKEGQKQTKLAQLGEWLRKNKNRFFPSGDGDKDDYEATVGKDDKDPSQREACVKEQYGGDASQAFETAYTVIEERDDEDRICPEGQEGAAACAAAKYKGDGQAAFSDAYQVLKATDSLELVCPPADTSGDAPGGSNPADLAGLRSQGWRLFVQQALDLGYTRESLVHILDLGVARLQIDNLRLYDLLRQHPAAFNVLLGLRRDRVQLSSCLPDGRLQRRANDAGQSGDICEIVRAMTSGKQSDSATPEGDGKENPSKQEPSKQEPPKEPENKFHDQVKKLQNASQDDGSWTGGILGAFFAGPLFVGSVLATSPEVVALIGEFGASLGLTGTAAGTFSESSAVGGALSAVRSAAARSVGSVLRRTIGRLNYLAHRGINPLVRRIVSDAVRAGTRAAERVPLLRAGNLVH
ncbi:hypothetical protein MY1884_008772 [Beauveria asiatica]